MGNLFSNNNYKQARFLVLTATSMKMLSSGMMGPAFWLVDGFLMAVAVNASEMLVGLYRATQHNVPEDRYLH
jgi:hypothetical protein